MKIVAVSDLHGHLPEIPPCDLLLIGGDICPHFRSRYVGDSDDIFGQAKWLGSTFRDWLDRVPARSVAATWGNHDWVGFRKPHMVPTLRWNLLVDRLSMIEGLRVYGSPWQPFFHDWAYNLPEEELAQKWDLIPPCDILVFHGPPRGYGDNAPRAGGAVERTGSPSQLARILAVKPKLVVFGHIHEGRGQWLLEGIQLANVAVLDEQYRPVHEPTVFEL